MELNINSPAYFTNVYGIDDEVYKYCQTLHVFFREKEYSDKLKIIGIIPVIAPEEEYIQGKWKESTRYISNGECASITIRIDYSEYYEADSSYKILLIKDMLLRAVKKVKSKARFDFERFREDLDCCDVI